MASPLKSASPRGHAAPGRGEYRSPELLALVTGLMARESDALRRIREGTVADGLPPISIGPDEGKILDFLVRLTGARRAVEIGTLAGYSACWIAGALPEGGRLHTLEYEPRHADVARRNLERAGVSGRVSVHVGPALESLPKLSAQGPFDFCFIDADKANYANYLQWAVKNVRPGGVVVGDNAYLFGKLHLPPEQAGEDGPGAAAMRAFLAGLADAAFFSSCAMLPTGEGMAVAVRK